MDTSDVDVSVVVPTYNRRDQLLRTLVALDEQCFIDDTVTFEVVVVSDGSTDGTDEAVERFRARHPVVLVRLANSGPGAARNAGVERARGDLVVFVDDDVIPARGFLDAHWRRHLENPQTVVVGPMLTPPDVTLSPWVAWEQYQLDKQYTAFEQGARCYPRQFYTGNASCPRRALLDVGGFDPSFRRAEDVELGTRLHDAGLDFVFEPAARAHHYAERSLDSWFQIAYDYGVNDVDFARSGRMATGLIAWFFATRPIAQRVLLLATLRPRRMAVALARSARDLGVATSHLGAVRVGRGLLSAGYALHYYRGVLDRSGSIKALLSSVPIPERSDRRRVWFLLEQTLGHVTHSRNLQALVPGIAGVEATFLPVPPDLDGWAARVPGWSNWTVRAGVRARRLLRRQRRSAGALPDAVFVHTQVPAVLLGRWMRRAATVVSLDATPRQYDELGEFYEHAVGSGFAERGKHWANRRCYERARHLVTWSQWAKDGLVADYGIDADKVTVIPPGVDTSRWMPGDRDAAPGPLRILFVGGNLARKGGFDLLEAAVALREDDAVPPFEVHVVTTSEVDSRPGVVVHRSMTPNSDELVRLYQSADIFCLPTHGDCLPMVLAEAGAAGLPLVSCDVGAISELVRPETTGLLVGPGDIAALRLALRRLLTDDALRRRLGANAHRLVEESHDAAINAGRIMSVIRSFES